jgi:peptidyl-prolyl cis-trans isomerase D
MLETMRGFAKGRMAQVLLAVLSLSFVSWGVRDFSGSFLDWAMSITGWGPKDLVHVGSTVIRADEYTKAMENARKNISSQTGQNVTLDDVRRMGIDQQVLDSLIDAAAVDVEYTKLGLTVSTSTILQDLASNPSFQDANNKFSPDIFKRALAQANISEAAFVAGQQQAILRAAVTEVASGQFASPKALDTALVQYREQTRDVKYFVVSTSEADVAQPSDADLKAQYEKTPRAYTAPEYRSVVVMKADPADIAARIQITPEELSAYYDQHKTEYFEPEKRTIIQLPFPSLDAAQKAKDRVTSGEDIAKIAAELNLKDADYTLAEKLKDDFLDKKIGEAAFALKEGEVSAPVQGSLATVLLKAVKVAPEKQPSLDEIKDKVTQRLQLEKAKDEIQSIYNAVEDARAQQTKFEAIAEKANIPLSVVPAVDAAGLDKDGKEIDLPTKPETLKALFASDVGVENDALTAGDGYVWYEVREVIPSALRPLESVKAQLIKDVIAELVRTAAADKAKALVEKAKAGATLDSLAVEAKADIKITAGLKRNEQSQEFDGQALNALFAAPDQGFAYSLDGDGKSAHVMQVVKDVLPPVLATPSEDVKKMQADTKSRLMTDLQAGLVRALRQNAKVTLNEELWQLNTRGGTQQQPQ